MASVNLDQPKIKSVDISNHDFWSVYVLFVGIWGIMPSNVSNYTFSFLPLFHELAFSSSSSKGIFSFDKETYFMPFVTLIDELKTNENKI